ncbi:MAG TPA: alpha/beta fold hydrolase [Candidatus Limnocylindrales bacterium]
MSVELIHVPVPGGEIVATRGASGASDGPAERPPVLLLHGGPGLGAEYMVGLVQELDGLIDGILPQQRGLGPSTLEGPRDVETHVADAIQVLDHLGWERAWLVGHSWGGHLAMHIVVAHPDRVLGLITLDTLGAVGDGGAAAMTSNLVARLRYDERARLDALTARRQRDIDDPDVETEIMTTIWPSHFHDPAAAPPFLFPRVEQPLPGVPGTVASVMAHLEARTLERGLPAYRGPALLIHGESDPLPSSASVDTAALISGARLELIEACGHFPWIERKGVARKAIAAILGVDRPVHRD